MNRTSSLKKSTFTRRFFPALLLWGIALRFLPLVIHTVLHGGVPEHHRGGLFYHFAVRIAESGLTLPQVIPHQGPEQLFFLYPPLTFWLAAVGMKAFQIGSEIILLLAALLSTIAFIVFAFYTQRRVANESERFLAILAFACSPELLSESLSGEGMAEAGGLLSFVLFFIVLQQKHGGSREAILLGVSAGLGMLFSPGTCLALPLSLALYYLLGLFLWDQSIGQTLKLSLLSLCVTLLTASPYLAHLLLRQDPTVLWESLVYQFQQGDIDGSTSFVSTLLPVDKIPNTGRLPVWHLAALLGLFRYGMARQWFLGIWPLLLALIPREGVWLYSACVPILAAHGLCTVIPKIHSDALKLGLLVYVAVCAPFFALFPDILSTNPTKGSRLQYYRSFVTKGEANSARRMSTLIPTDAAVLIFGDEAEWMPYLMKRKVFNSWQGLEFQSKTQQSIGLLNKRLTEVHSCDELKVVLASFRGPPLYLPENLFLYISKRDAFKWKRALASPALLNSLREHPEVEQVLDTPHATLFRLPLS